VSDESYPTLPEITIAWLAVRRAMNEFLCSVIDTTFVYRNAAGFFRLVSVHIEKLFHR
jgi:hypothetical protein